MQLWRHYPKQNFTKSIQTCFHGALTASLSSLVQSFMVLQSKVSRLQPPPFNDHRNNLGKDSIIGCRKNVTDSKPPDKNQTEKEEVFDEIITDPTESFVTINSQGSFPVDLTGGCPTMFLYCNLVQNDLLGDRQTALLRAVPLQANDHLSQLQNTLIH